MQPCEVRRVGALRGPAHTSHSWPCVAGPFFQGSNVARQTDSESNWWHRKGASARVTTDLPRATAPLRVAPRGAFLFINRCAFAPHTLGGTVLWVARREAAPSPGWCHDGAPGELVPGPECASPNLTYPASTAAYREGAGAGADGGADAGGGAGAGAGSRPPCPVV